MTLLDKYEVADDEELFAVNRLRLISRFDRVLGWVRAGVMHAEDYRALTRQFARNSAELGFRLVAREPDRYVYTQFAAVRWHVPEEPKPVLGPLCLDLEPWETVRRVSL